MQTLYSLLYALGLCAYLPRTAWAMLSGGRYAAGLGQRLGHLPEAARQAPSGGIWVHAVSVGEVHAARGLVHHLRRLAPGLSVALSTTTATGHSLAARVDVDTRFYFPVDLPFAYEPWLDELRPRALVLVETEIWPNLLRACAERDVAVAVVNARLSAASFARYRRLGRWWRDVLRQLTVVCARTSREAERLAALGVRADRLWVTGNLKADAAVLESPLSERQALAETLRINGGSPLLVAGCTMPGEEEQVLEAFEMTRAASPHARLLLAPRHPERFDHVARAVEAAGWRCRRRSGPGPEDAEVILLDTIGELPAAYGLAVASFVGGSLVPTGGHNALEPAVYGQPVLFGPHMFNFASLAADFLAAGAAVQVEDAGSLGRAWIAMLTDHGRRQRLGSRARHVALRDGDAGRRTATILLQHGL